MIEHEKMSYIGCTLFSDTLIIYYANWLLFQILALADIDKARIVFIYCLLLCFLVIWGKKGLVDVA